MALSYVTWPHPIPYHKMGAAQAAEFCRRPLLHPPIVARYVKDDEDEDGDDEEKGHPIPGRMRAAGPQSAWPI